MMETLGEMNVRKVHDRGRIRFFINGVHCGRRYGKVINAGVLTAEEMKALRPRY
jgi:hypothetical protein